ncbi:MAG: LEA type 2 family protein [Candidatus Margulisbacteria bacterium]|nr:LEA type 2 family protein [Candidatus Margulisiibacteriota bacterium]
MRKKLSAIFLVCSAVFFLESCVDIKQPQVRFDRTEITGLDMQKARANFIFKIQNPNSIGLDEASYDYKLSINNLDFLEAKNNKFSLPANRESTVILPVEVNYIKAFNTMELFAKSILSGQDSIPYELSGNFHFQFIAFPISIPFKQKGVVPLPVLPGITIKSVSIEKAGLTDIVLNFKVGLNNNNNFTLPLQNMDYQVKINGQNVAGGVAADITDIAQNSSRDVSVLVKTNIFQLGEQLMSVLNRKGFNYRFSGNLRTGDMSVPFDIAGSSENN